MGIGLAHLRLHVDHPHKAWVVVEQPRDETRRIEYVPETGEFRRTANGYLLHARGFRGLYGWIAGTGTPPAPHHDVMVLTSIDAQSGEVVEARICGAFRRADGDNKFVALGLDIECDGMPDLLGLEGALQAQLYRLYPDVREGEAWLGGDEARAFLRANEATHD